MSNNDTIYRQDAIDVVEKWFKRIELNGDICLDGLRSLPSAQQWIPCSDEVLDKIRAEIVEEKEHAYADFERYKVEYLGQDWEDVLNSLPQDDFRYGMERAIELIDKYKAESEE